MPQGANEEVVRRRRGRPPGSKVDPAARREAVLDATEIEMAEHGEQFGLSAIGQRLGYARSALYAVFDNRDELLDALAARHADRLARDTASALAAVGDSREQTTVVVGVLVGWITHHRHLAVALPPRMGAGASRPRLTDPIEDALEQALLQAGGDSRAAAPWAHAVVGAAWAAALWHTEIDCMDGNQLVEHITNLIWRGLATSIAADTP